MLEEAQISTLVSILRCPYCFGCFELENVSGVGSIYNSYGLLKCDCNIFPVLHGIPLLSRGFWAQRLGNLILGKKFEMATSQRLAQDVLDGRIRPLFRRILRKMGISNGLARKFAKAAAFRDAIPLGFRAAPAYGEYMRCRFGDLTHIAGEFLIAHMTPRKGWILDVPSGAGHFSWRTRQRHPGARTAAVDFSFFHLLCLKRFFVSDALCVCSDANLPLPFQSDQVEAVICSDELHYITAQGVFIEEMQRVSVSGANILLLHIHNANAENPTRGDPLRLRQLTRMVQSTFPEEDFCVWDESVLAVRAIDGGQSLGGGLTAQDDSQVFAAWIHNPPSLDGKPGGLWIGPGRENGL